MDKKTITVIIAIVAALFLFTMPTEEMLVIMLSLPALILAITFHEFAHAKTAELLGDKTPRKQGRISLNPIKHVSLMGMISLFFLRIGWGKPVMVDIRQMNKIKNKKLAEALVALAGPFINIILAFLITLIYGLLLKYEVPLGKGYYEIIIHNIIFAMISINLGLAVFNLLPIPPLDGFSILSLILPKNFKTWIDKNQIVISIIFLALIWTGFLSKLTVPFLNSLINGMLNLVARIIA